MNKAAIKDDLNHDLQAALQSVEAVLERQQDNENLAQVSGHFSHAVQSMVHLRNRITAIGRAGTPSPDGISLDRINALISVMAGIEYPAAGIHWPRIQQVRDGLKQMMHG
jgi:hypothetical protein